MTRDELWQLPPDHRLAGHQYTVGELRDMIGKMRDVNAEFYIRATTTGCHTFIEFCGLQAKFIDLCEESLLRGIEFPFASRHSGTELALANHHADYLGEKFACIWGHTIASDPGLRRTFERAAFGK